MDGLEFDPSLLMNWDEDQDSSLDDAGFDTAAGSQQPPLMSAAPAIVGVTGFENWRLDPVMLSAGDRVLERNHYHTDTHLHLQPQQPVKKDFEAMYELPSTIESRTETDLRTGSNPLKMAPYCSSRWTILSSSCSPHFDSHNSQVPYAGNNSHTTTIRKAPGEKSQVSGGVKFSPSSAVTGEKLKPTESTQRSSISSNAASAPSAQNDLAKTSSAFAYPQTYQFNQGHNHPLAMTSLASCPPYVNVGSLHPNSNNKNSSLIQTTTSANTLSSQSASTNPFIRHMKNSTNGLEEASSDQLGPLVQSQPFVKLNEITTPVENHDSLQQTSVRQKRSPYTTDTERNSKQGNQPSASISELPSSSVDTSSKGNFKHTNPPRSTLEAQTLFSNAFANAMSNSNGIHKSNVPSLPNQNPPYHHQHYGMIINGFHPQVNAQVNPVLPMPSAGGVISFGAMNMNNALNNFHASNIIGCSTDLSNSNDGALSGTTTSSTDQKSTACNGKTALSSSESNNNITVADASNGAKSARERNEREQMRAKKITQLIHELRTNMQNGGWKQEMKSKYQTLSQCKDYMDYLKKLHKDKEADIEFTKKLIEEKALFEARSDPESIPESVTSTLTASTVRCNSPESISDKDDSSTSSRGEKKRKPFSSTLENGNGKEKHKFSKYQIKKSRSRDKPKGADNPASSTESSSEDDAGNESPGGKKILFDKASSSVSDMTDSNRSSADGTGLGSSISKGKSSFKVHKRIHESISGCSNLDSRDIPMISTGDLQSSSSISSTAAVARGVMSSQKSLSHNDNRRHHSSVKSSEGAKAATIETNNEKTVCAHKKKRRGFEYDYKEVFLKSNVPQLIATLSGRIVVWNDFFLLVTGLNEREAKRQTIFNIVQSSELTNLYKMVARALSEAKGENAMKSAIAENSPYVSQENDLSASAKRVSKKNNEEWQAITLKCIPFPCKKTDGESHHPNILYITIALMADDDQQQRCFHCILSDCPGTNGKIGIVTPELLAMLFSSNEKSAMGKRGEDNDSPMDD